MPTWVILGGVFIALGIGPSAARADECDDSSAVDQYQECIPNSGGETPTDGENGNQGSGGGNGGGSGGQGDAAPSVAPEVSEAVASEGGSDAPLLKKAVSSPAYGAPKARLRPEGPTAAHVPAEAIAPSSGSALAAAASAVSDGHEGRFIGIVTAVFVISAAALGATALRQRRSRI